MHRTHKAAFPLKRSTAERIKDWDTEVRGNFEHCDYHAPLQWKRTLVLKVPLFIVSISPNVVKNTFWEQNEGLSITTYIVPNLIFLPLESCTVLVQDVRSTMINVTYFNRAISPNQHGENQIRKMKIKSYRHQAKFFTIQSEYANDDMT